MRYLQTLLCSLLIASLSVLPALSQTPLSAYVYVSTAKGVYLYNAASTGKLTRVAGPYALPGLAIGSNGKYFITVGTTYVHAYGIAANGTIKPQVSQINTQLYGGAECGTTAGGVLDHTGQFLYVQTAGAPDPNNPEDILCDAEQSYKINSTNGQFTFIGDTHFDFVRSTNAGSALSITANDLFAYNTTPVFQWCGGEWWSFQRDSAGALSNYSPAIYGPTPYPGWYDYPNGPMAADPHNNLAVYVGQEDNDGNCEAGPSQLATYSADYQGDLYSQDTWQTMPAPPINVTEMNMSPAGNLLAIGGNSQHTDWYGYFYPAGLMVYHYNGASTPITPYSGVLTKDAILSIHWDKKNHLYALSATKLYVYTITPTSITPVATYPIASGKGLFVVPK